MLIHIHLIQIIVLTIAGFCAAFIDASVGGGGLLSLPALLIVGLPPAMALGTNKLGSTLSSCTSSIAYFRSGKISFHLVKYLIPLSLTGSICGAYLVHHLPTGFLKPVVIILLISVTIYTIFKKDIGQYMTYQGITRKLLIIASCTALVIGFYDGFFGPGTGSFLIISFLFMGFDFVSASGNAKSLNLASNLGALVTFAFFHAINYELGLILGIAMILGAFTGAKIAIRRGIGYLRPIFIGMTSLMIGQQLWTILKIHL